LPLSCHPLFTITETVGTGSGGALFPDVSELVTVDFASIHHFTEEAVRGVTLALQDASGPFDYHLTHHLLKLCQQHQIPVQTAILEAHHSDSSSAIVAGHDVRTAVITCGGHASHSVERVHIDSLCNVAWLLASHLPRGQVCRRDPQLIAPFRGFSRQPEVGQIRPQDRRRPSPADLSRGYAIVPGPNIDCV